MTGILQAPLAVLGAGSWGTALAIQCARSGRPVRLWGRAEDDLDSMAEAGENRRYLPGARFPPALTLEADFGRALEGCADVLIAVPSHAFRDLLEQLRAFPDPGRRLAWATKGLEPGTGRLAEEVVREVLGPEVPTAVLSGPTFAREVGAGLPTAITVASADPDFAEDLATTLHAENFRPYTASDVTGVELGGAVKNVIAIGAGISDGLGFGANARIALITRGLAEMMRLGLALGARQETFMGLAGMGDLILTCTDNQSRNRRLGLALAEGRSVDDFRRELGQVVEGVLAAREVRRLAARVGVEMPICEQVYRVIYEGVSPRDAVEALLGRERKAENG
ncbi:MAG: NAD(P)H-dependent glycerol-3-phosphate dehydrogenase [Gammaproteobacteria bacterium]|jgi:glycerol-3-phosphate dehydrogenase (NAD(P)+)